MLPRIGVATLCSVQCTLLGAFFRLSVRHRRLRSCNNEESFLRPSHPRYTGIDSVRAGMVKFTAVNRDVDEPYSGRLVENVDEVLAH